MQRPIKFRAFGKSDESDKPVMSKVNLMDTFKDELGYDYQTFWTDVGIMNGVMHRGEAFLMQYTGLKDKNSVEIYEGDIVKSVWTRFDNDELPYVVAYEDGCCYASCEQEDDHYQLADIEWEVIGNIYQNPELLN